MKKLLLTSMLCFCMLMQGCTISELDTAEDKIVNIDGNVECSWGMSVEDINRFTKDDVVCALEMFNEDYVTFPRDDIAKLSGLTMPVNKRNWRKQPVHLQGARAIQEINDKANGTNWREGNGRPKGSGTAQARVYEWRQQHPEGRKADCHRETGLDPKTVRKWWDCPPPAVRFENGHITVRVSPSQELSDWLLDALHDGGQE